MPAGVFGGVLGLVIAGAPLTWALRRLSGLSGEFPIHPASFRRLYSGGRDVSRSRTGVLPQLLGDDRLRPLAVALALPNADRRIADVDEALADLETVLGDRRASRPAFLRLFAFGGLLAFLIALLEGATFVSALPLVVVVGAGGVGFFVVDRAIESISADLREAVDGWVDAGMGVAIHDVLGRPPREPSDNGSRIRPLPSRRRMP